MMDFGEKLALGHSKVITEQIVMEIIAHPKRMDELMTIFFKGPDQITQRASWVVSIISEKNPNLLFNYFEPLIGLLDIPKKHNAINRHIIRAFQFVDIPIKYQGNILNSCFKLLNSSQEPVAVKAFSMNVIFKLSKKYPDIIPELRASIESLLPHGSPGIKSRGNKILKAIS